MGRGQDEGVALVAAHLRAAGRWLAGAVVAMTLVAVAGVVSFTPEQTTTKLGLSLVMALGAIQAYLAVRIAFDRGLFGYLVARSGGETAGESR